jgi:hypothetical protein
MQVTKDGLVRALDFCSKYIYEQIEGSIKKC